MSVLYLTEADVAQLLDMPTALDLVREAFAQLAAGQAENVPRQRAAAPGVVLHTMSAAAGWLRVVGWKNYTTTRQGAQFQVGLCDAETGGQLALIEADLLGQMRTGAVTGIAASLLAGAGADTLGLIGAGWQAESQLAAVVTACQLRRVDVYCRDPQRRREFADRMSKRHDIEVRAAASAESAVRGHPLVVTATSSKRPVLDSAWLASGALVAAIGSNWLHKSELDAATIAGADRIVCDSVAACRLEAGEFVEPLAAGSFAWSDVVELADVVAGNVVGRQQEQQRIVFKSVGMAIEDVAVAHWLWRTARERGLGEELPMLAGKE